MLISLFNLCKLPNYSRCTFIFPSGAAILFLLIYRNSLSVLDIIAISSYSITAH